MPQQPWWSHPAPRKVHNDRVGPEIARMLHEHGLTHLKVVGRGAHLVVYSEEDGIKSNRVRFTRVDDERYQLGFATHRGTWEQTPFEGSLSELVLMLVEQFAFTLEEF
jgi:hypothetical protein